MKIASIAKLLLILIGLVIMSSLFSCEKDKVDPVYCYACNGVVIFQTSINSAQYEKINVNYCVTELEIELILDRENVNDQTAHIYKNLKCEKVGLAKIF